MEVVFTALKKTRHEISFVLDPTPVNGFWSHPPGTTGKALMRDIRTRAGRGIRSRVA